MKKESDRCIIIRVLRWACCLIVLTLPLWYFDVVLVEIFLKSANVDKLYDTEVEKEQKRSNLRHMDEKTTVDPTSPILAASGQHLLLDLKGSSFDILNDEEYLREATLRIVEETKMNLLGIESYKLEPQGVSVVALLAESHLSIHTWPEFGSALIDLFTCGESNLQNHLEYVVDQYGGNLTESTYSVVPRGDSAKGEPAEKDPQFKPAEIMTIHKYKKKVFETQSPYQHIGIWDHHDTQEDDFGTTTMRSLYLDGIIQSNAFDEEKYHESLVHPAFIGSAEPVKRVLIVGGGEGGTLRESLKWKSVEKVFMVELDKAVIDASRKYLPSYSNCTGYGTKCCFDDTRVELYIGDFVEWFDNYLGNDICEKADSKRELLFDVIILDLLDSEYLPEDEEWARHLYSDSFFERIACATTPYGAVVSNFGEAPEGPFTGGPSRPEEEQQKARRDMFSRKIEQMQGMSKFFRHFRVYDTAVPSFRANWAFAIGMVPKESATGEDGETSKNFDKGSATGLVNAGVNAFDGKVALVNLKLSRGLHEKAVMEFYDGACQHSFQYPTGDWQGVYCSIPEHKQICDLPKLLRKSLDYEEEWFELKLNEDGDGTSGTVAKKDIPKGHITGLFDSATSVEIPAFTYYALAEFAKDEEAKYRKLFEAINGHGFHGGMDETGDTVYMSAGSLHAFTNHACDHKPTLADITETWPWASELWEAWNPVTDRIRSEINHLAVAARDIKKGEMVTKDYTRWGGNIAEVEWCGTGRDNDGNAAA